MIKYFINVPTRHFAPLCVLVILFFFYSNIFSQTAVDSSKINIHITLDRTNFTQYELIDLELIVTNLSNQSIQIPEPDWASTVKIILTDSSGKILEPAPTPLTNGKTKLIKLDPKRFVTDILDLGNFKNYTPKSYQGIPGPALSPGKYQVQVKYVNLLSNILDFTINAAADSDIIVMKEIQNNLLGSNHELLIKSTTDFIAKHPSNKYLPQVYGWLLIRYHSSNNTQTHLKEMKQAVINYIDRYPRSSFAPMILSTYARAVAKSSGINYDHKLNNAEIAVFSGALNDFKIQYSANDWIQTTIDKIIYNFSH